MLGKKQLKLINGQNIGVEDHEDLKNKANSELLLQRFHMLSKERNTTSWTDENA